MHRRRSLRLPQFDYATAGAYFVTICAHQRQNIFGEIINEEMKLNDVGRVVQATWNGLSLRFPSIELDEYTIMPNHFHGIILISDQPERYSVGAGFPRPPTDEAAGIAQGAVTAPLRRGTIGQMMAFFKYVSTKNINGRDNRLGRRIWQRNYYEHVIRDSTDLDRIRQYILENPQKWALDSENPANVNNG